MKKMFYICNRCREEIRTEGTCIIPYFFDLTTGELLKEAEAPDHDVHFCMSCTKKVMEEILTPAEAGIPVHPLSDKKG